MSLRRLRNPTNVISVFLLPQEMRTKSDSNSRFPLSILFIFRLAAALPHLPHAAMTSMAWNRCISSYRIIPVSSFVLNFHALTRTKLKFMAGDHVSIWWRVITISSSTVYNKNYYGPASHRRPTGWVFAASARKLAENRTTPSLRNECRIVSMDCAPDDDCIACCGG